MIIIIIIVTIVVKYLKTLIKSESPAKFPLKHDFRVDVNFRRRRLAMDSR